MKIMKPFIIIKNKICSSLYYKKLRKKIPNFDITLVSQDCTAGMIYHQIGKRFDSPFINTLIYREDYFKILQNFKEYMDADLIENKNNKENYPIGEIAPKGLDKVHIHFIHKKLFEDAKNEWDKRKKRIHYDKLVFIYNLTNISLEEDEFLFDCANKFNDLNVSNKIILIRKELNIPNSIYINVSDKPFVNAIIFTPKNKNKEWKKYIDDMNYLNLFSFFNKDKTN